MQIKETGAGTYPPVVYQPLRSPKSPFAKYGGPGSSCTLPAKLGARLMTQSLAYNERNSSKTKRLMTNEGQSKNVIAENPSLEEQQHQLDAATILPRFLHSNYSSNYYPNEKSLSSSTTTDLKAISYDQNHQPQKNQFRLIDDDDEQARDSHSHHDHGSVDRTIRSSSEENSNASSGGYFSEDSSQQSITTSCDLPGSPFELKVQLRQCSDEKILKKNLSDDNLLAADYINRPNEKCKYSSLILAANHQLYLKLHLPSLTNNLTLLFLNS